MILPADGVCYTDYRPAFKIDVPSRPSWWCPMCGGTDVGRPMFGCPDHRTKNVARAGISTRPTG